MQRARSNAPQWEGDSRQLGSAETARPLNGLSFYSGFP